MCALTRGPRAVWRDAPERFQVDAKTVRKWRDRFEREGAVGPAVLTSTACRIGKDDARGSLVSLAKLSAFVLE
jgi:hypothetical protein